MKGGDGRPRSKDGEASLQEEKNRGRRVGSRRREEIFFFSPVVFVTHNHAHLIL